MDRLKLGRNGEVTIPQAILDRLSLTPGETLQLELTEDGAICLRPTAAGSLESYSESRIREFEDLTAVDERTREAVTRRLREPSG